jgi:hypothetical protein
VDGALVRDLRPDESNLAKRIRAVSDAEGAAAADAEATAARAACLRAFSSGTPAADDGPLGLWSRGERRGLASRAGDLLDALELSLAPQPSPAATAATLATARSAPVLLLLNAAGQFIGDLCQSLATDPAGPPSSVVVLLGDDRGLSEVEERRVRGLAAKAGAVVHTCSLGGETLFASHSIVIVHHYLDRVLHSCATRPPRTLARGGGGGGGGGGRRGGEAAAGDGGVCAARARRRRRQKGRSWARWQGRAQPRTRQPPRRARPRWRRRRAWRRARWRGRKRRGAEALQRPWERGAAADGRQSGREIRPGHGGLIDTGCTQRHLFLRPPVASQRTMAVCRSHGAAVAHAARALKAAAAAAAAAVSALARVRRPGCAAAWRSGTTTPPPAPRASQQQPSPRPREDTRSSTRPLSYIYDIICFCMYMQAAHR